MGRPTVNRSTRSMLDRPTRFTPGRFTVVRPSEINSSLTQWGLRHPDLASSTATRSITANLPRADPCDLELDQQLADQRHDLQRTKLQQPEEMGHFVVPLHAKNSGGYTAAKGIYSTSKAARFYGRLLLAQLRVSRSIQFYLIILTTFGYYQIYQI